MVANKNDLVNNSLSKIKSAPGFGGRIGAGIGYIGTMDYIDTDKDGVDDRNQRGPGQPYITFEKATQEEKNRFNQPRGKGVDQRGRQPRGNYAKNYMDTFARSAQGQKTQAPKDFGDYTPASFGGSLYNQGWGNMVDWGNKFKDNEAIQGFISGSRLDANQTMMNMGMDLLYQKGQLSQMADYQGGMENLKTGNTLKLLAAEGGITRDLMWDQGDIKSRQIGEQGREDRAQIRTLGTENRLTKMTEGDQDRKTQRDKYREERKMRADARGAIRRTGSRFFG
tara:strand:+ start:1009 stop:1851 length:843 start_codon:yes stop_codon:yes gene_type:complete